MTVNVVTEAPELDHGDTDASPKPEPRAMRTSDNAAAANAPPMIAGQATADIEAPSGLRSSTSRPRMSAMGGYSGMRLPLLQLVKQQHEHDDDRDRHA